MDPLIESLGEPVAGVLEFLLIALDKEHVVLWDLGDNLRWQKVKVYLLL